MNQFFKQKKWFKHIKDWKKNRKKLPNSIKVPLISKTKETKESNLMDDSLHSKQVRGKTAEMMALEYSPIKYQR